MTNVLCDGDTTTVKWIMKSQQGDKEREQIRVKDGANKRMPVNGYHQIGQRAS